MYSANNKTAYAVFVMYQAVVLLTALSRGKDIVAVTTALHCTST